MEEAFWDSSDDLMAAVFSVLHDILCGWECTVSYTHLDVYKRQVVMELQMVERGVQAVESHQPDHNRISATGTLNHPQKENKRPGMPTDRKDDGMEVQEEEWEEDITVGFVPGNGGPRNQDLFFSAREGREFTQVLQEVQEYVSSKYATLLTGHDDADVKAQIKRYITKYIQDYRIAVQGMTMVQLVDTCLLYTS